MTIPRDIGFPYKKGQIIRFEGQIYEVSEDVEWLKDFKLWGSVWLIGFYPPLFTHKGGIELVKEAKS